MHTMFNNSYLPLLIFFYIYAREFCRHNRLLKKYKTTCCIVWELFFLLEDNNIGLELDIHTTKTFKLSIFSYKCVSMFFIYTCETRFDSVEFFNCWNNFRDLLSSMLAIEIILKLNACTLWEKIVLSAHPALPPRFKLLNDKCFLFLPETLNANFLVCLRINTCSICIRTI